MAEGDSYGCKTYFLISLEGVLYLLQFVSRTTSFDSFCVYFRYLKVALMCFDVYFTFVLVRYFTAYEIILNMQVFF